MSREIIGIFLQSLFYWYSDLILYKLYIILYILKYFLSTVNSIVIKLLLEYSNFTNSKSDSLIIAKNLVYEFEVAKILNSLTCSYIFTYNFNIFTEFVSLVFCFNNLNPNIRSNIKNFI